MDNDKININNTASDEYNRLCNSKNKLPRYGSILVPSSTSSASASSSDSKYNPKSKSSNLAANYDTDHSSSGYDTGLEVNGKEVKSPEKFKTAGGNGRPGSDSNKKHLKTLASSDDQSFQVVLNNLDEPDKDKEEEEEEADKGREMSFVEKAARKIPCLGILLALCASIFLGATGVLVKLTHSVHGVQVAVFRAMIQSTIYGVIIFCRGLNWSPHKSELKAVLGRTIFGASSITFSYSALKLIPLADATTIRFSMPIWTLIIGYVVLKEKCGLIHLVAVVACISGVVLIAKPDECVKLFWQLFGSQTNTNTTLVNSLESSFRVYSHPASSLGNNISLIRGHVEHVGTLIQPKANDSFESRIFSIENNDQDSTLELVLPVNDDYLKEDNQQTTNELNSFFNSNDTSGKFSYNNTSTHHNHNHHHHHHHQTNQYSQFEGTLLALASSINLAISIVCLRLCKQTPAEITILWLSIGSVIIGSVLLVSINEWRMPDNWLDVLFILLNGLFGALGQWFITNALKIEQSGVISLTRTADIQVAFIYSAILLHEPIRMTSVIGSIVVTFGVVCVAVPKLMAEGGLACCCPMDRRRKLPPNSSQTSTPTLSSNPPSATLVDNSNRKFHFELANGKSEKACKNIPISDNSVREVYTKQS